MRASWLLVLTPLLIGCSAAAPISTALIPAAVPTPSVVDAWTPAARAKSVNCVSEHGLPDPDCTPGALDPRVTQATIGTTICISGYSTRVRPAVATTERIKREEMQAYGVADQPLSAYELDHLVSLELGGAPEDIANLWPENWTDAPDAPGAHVKDRVENAAHMAVCSGRMTLSTAQQAIANDWVDFGRALGIVQ